MTDLAVPNRSHIFSPVLILLQLVLYRLDLYTMVFADDIVLLGHQPSVSPEPAPVDGMARLHENTFVPVEDASVRVEVDTDPICNFPETVCLPRCLRRVGKGDDKDPV
jgi:hypothetical protein